MKNIVIILSFLSFSVSASTFKQILNQMVENDPEFIQTFQNTDALKYDRRSAQTKLFLPTADLNLAKVNDESIVSNVIGQYFNGSLRLSYEFFTFGRDYHNFKSFDSRFKAQSELLKQKRIEQEAKISEVIFQYLRIKKEYTLIKSLVDLKSKSLNIAKRRFKSGNFSNNDMIRIEIDFENSQSELFSTQEQLSISKAFLDQYNVEYKELSFPWTNSLLFKGIKNLLERKKLNTARLEYLKQLEKQSKHQALSLKRNMWGSFSINYSRNVFKTEEDEKERYGWQASIMYTLPLFRHYDQYKQYKKESASLSSLKAQRRFQLKTDLNEVDMRSLNLKTSFRTFKQRMKVLKLSKKLYKVSLDSFRKGRISVNELFLEQDRLLTTQKISNSSLFDVHMGVMKLVHAKGLSVTKINDLF